MMQPVSPYLPPSRTAVAAYKETNEVPDGLLCPITLQPLKRPVRVGATGEHLYSEQALLTWMRHQAAEGLAPTDPFTRRPLAGVILIPEPAATAAINALRRGAAALRVQAGNLGAATTLREMADESESLLRRPPLQVPTHLAVQEAPRARPRILDLVTYGFIVGAQVGTYAHAIWGGHRPDTFNALIAPFATTLTFNKAIHAPPARFVRALIAGSSTSVAVCSLFPCVGQFVGVAVGLGTLML